MLLPKEISRTAVLSEIPLPPRGETYAVLPTAVSSKNFYRLSSSNLYARNERVRLTYDAIKPILDFSVAIALLIALLPLFLAVAVAIKLTSSGPVILKQKRLTKDGQVFIMYKFRTMRNDAERNTGAVWASEHDPRITPLGKYLRNFRLDELPQLLNVIFGDMSLIGPRPERPELACQIAEKIPEFYRRLEVKAGITGLAQVAHRYASSLDDYQTKMFYDINYVNNRSFLLDLLIAAKTLRVVITGAGAR